MMNAKQYRPGWKISMVSHLDHLDLCAYMHFYCKDNWPVV